MTEQNEPSENKNTNQSKQLPKIALFLLILVGFVMTFISGYFVHRLFAPEGNKPTEGNNSIAPPQNDIPISQNNTTFTTGAFYFEDTIIAITKDSPHMTFAATVTRLQGDKNYTQRSRMSYNDGKNWNRFSDSKTTTDSTIVRDNLVKSWVTNIDPSRVLKESIKGELDTNDTKILFSTNNLDNEIGIRSLPGYTKFMSHGTGSVTINGETHQAYILYDRIYSLNASDIQFYNQPFGLTTDWVAFWDTDGNFYHVDATTVDKPTNIYQTHHIGIFDDKNYAVTKTFNVSISRDAQVPPAAYTINLKAPIAKTLTFKRTTSVNKAPGSSYQWYMGNIEGTVTTTGGKTINGIGLVEYIHD